MTTTTNRIEMMKKKINSLLRRSHEAATRCSCSVVSSKIRRRRSRRPSKKINNNNSCLFLELLPVEIAADIFSRLPFHSVLQCKLVCKTWRDLLNNNNNNSIVDQKAAAGGFLLQIHYKKPPGFYYGEYDEKLQLVPTYNFNLTKKAIFNHQYPFEDIWNWYVVGSCNGLICLWSKKFGISSTSWSCKHGTERHHHDMYVCNPYTGEYAKLPNKNHPRLLHHLIPSHGFGYHPITKEYKVIRIYYQRDSLSSPTSVHVQVYTLGSNTSAWRSIGEIKHQLHRSYLWGNDSDNTSWGIHLNGVLYWLTVNAKHIISFDLADEEFRRIWTTPDEFHGPGVLGVLNGCLCFSISMNESTHIWVMNNNDYSWSKEFSISWRNGFKPYPLAQLESGKLLLHYNFNRFCSYDPETEHAVKLKMRDRFFDIIPYMKSTVSLKALGEKKAIQVVTAI